MVTTSARFNKTILIKNGRVWDGERFLDADVLIEEGIVIGVEPNITCEADLVYDASGKIVSAGLVDAHVHMRGISIEKFGAPVEMSSFPFGVTAVADASAERGTRELLDSFLVKSVVFAKVGLRDNHADFTNTEKALAIFGDKAVGVKVYFDEQISDIQDVTPLREACEFAHARGLRVMVHCSNSPSPMADILNTLGEGDILTHAFHGGANTAAADDFASMREAQARGVIIDIGFAGHTHTDFGVLAQALANGIVPDVISTDITKRSLYTRGGKYGLTLCMSMAKLLGMREEDIFRAVTSNPAKAMGKADEWGALRVGHRSDVSVLEQKNDGFDFTDKAGNHIESATGYRCVLTIADGQIVWRDE